MPWFLGALAASIGLGFWVSKKLKALKESQENPPS